jgi:Tol biopolymer transport system component
MKARHFAALSTFIITVLAIAVIVVVSSLKGNPKPREIGEFEFENTRTKVYQAGDCQVFATKWKNNENPNFFFTCGDRR